jgi:ATP-dependent exoDNAse (exonuclease V) alpha subunit
VALEPAGIVALAAAAGFAFKRLADRFKASSRPKPDTSGNTASSARPQVRHDSEIQVLPEYRLVADLVRSEFPLVFVTGGAGTGKSMFIKWLHEEFDGQMLLCAPTGIAALNIGGRTIHSLCQFPPAPRILPSDIRDMLHRKDLRAAKLLVIDEISMVTANLLDGVSACLRKNRQVDKPFGGLPVVLVGDMFQLPPVVMPNDVEWLESVYGTSYFFGAKSLRCSTFYAVELKNPFRHCDPEFASTLARIREGEGLDDAIRVVNDRAAVRQSPPPGAVWLSPRRVEVDARNAAELAKIAAPVRVFEGRIEDQFNPRDDRLPSPMSLALKVGAQVMFTKNGPDWVNGTVGVVEALGEESIQVRLFPSEKVMQVPRAAWPEYRYVWDPATGRIERQEVGRYVQFPLVLAWSMTIHKSQGKTIDRVHLDAGAGMFATGQAYVALSRCRTFEGLSLRRPLTAEDVRIDSRVVEFYAQLRQMMQNLPPEKLMHS